MVRKIGIIGNIIGLIVVTLPIVYSVYISIKYSEASSVAIIGGNPGGLSDIFYSYLTDFANNIFPLLVLMFLFCLNIYILITNKGTNK